MAAVSSLKDASFWVPTFSKEWPCERPDIEGLSSTESGEHDGEKGPPSEKPNELDEGLRCNRRSMREPDVPTF